MELPQKAFKSIIYQKVLKKSCFQCFNAVCDNGKKTFSLLFYTVPEVKDTVHKHSLLHHLCNMVIENSPNSTDLYSEIGPINRAAKADFAELANNIKYLERFVMCGWRGWRRRERIK